MEETTCTPSNVKQLRKKKNNGMTAKQDDYNDLRSLTEENSFKLESMQADHAETKELVKTVRTDISDVKVKTAQLSTDMGWLKKFLWVVMTASIGSCVGVIFQLVAKVVVTKP